MPKIQLDSPSEQPINHLTYIFLLAIYCSLNNELMGSNKQHMDDMLQSICQMSEITVLAPFEHGVLDGIILFIENLVKEGDFSFAKHEIWTLLWRRVEQLIHIQSQNGTWSLLSMEAINVLFSCLERLTHDNKESIDVQEFSRADSIVLSVAKSVVEYCPNVMRALTSAFNLKGCDKSKFSRAIVNSGIIGKLKLPKELSRENAHVAFVTIHLWRLTLENSATNEKTDILECIFKAIPTSIEAKSADLMRDEITSENLLYIMTQLARSGKKRYLALAVKILIGKN